MRRLAPWAALAIAAALLAASGRPMLGLGLRIGVVLASAAPIGGVLLRAIARLTGAGWAGAVRPPGALVPLIPLAALAMLGATGAAVPAHLALWSHPLAAAARAAAAAGALAWAEARLRAGAGATFAGVTLALYAALVTPLAADWLLPAAPGHPVSAVGMTLFLVQFAAGCAWAVAGGGERTRRDLAPLLVAAMLGLCYLAFVDYLIVWFGNLPARVPFYLHRDGWTPLAGLAIGLGGTLAGVVAGRERWAAATAAAGLFLFACWWIGGGLLAAAVGLAVAGAALASMERGRG